MGIPYYVTHTRTTTVLVNTSTTALSLLAPVILCVFAPKMGPRCNDRALAHLFRCTRTTGFTLISPQVEVINMRSGFKMAVFREAAASFGRSIPENGLHGRAVMAEPKEGCDEMKAALPDPKLHMPMIAVIGKTTPNCTRHT